jgi:hypothetical protein
MSNRPTSIRWAIVLRVGLPLVLLGGAVLLPWINKPLFASVFSTREPWPFPSWDYAPWTDEHRNAVLFEDRSNSLLVVIPVPKQTLGFRGARGQLTVLTHRDDRILIKDRPGTLTVIEPELSVHVVSLGRDEGARMYAEWRRTRDSAEWVERARSSDAKLDTSHVQIVRSAE